jgi:hypothetical protein
MCTFVSRKTTSLHASKIAFIAGEWALTGMRALVDNEAAA